MTVSINEPQLGCPICEAGITLDDKLLVGELINCIECGSDIEVVQDNEKLALKIAPDVQEDWGE